MKYPIDWQKFDIQFLTIAIRNYGRLERYFRKTWWEPLHISSKIYREAKKWRATKTTLIKCRELWLNLKDFVDSSILRDLSM